MFVLFLITLICLSLLLLCSQRVVVSIHQRYFRSWRVLFLLLFLTHIIWLHQFWDIRPYTSSLILLFSCPFVLVPPSTTFKIVLIILQGGCLGVYLFDEISATSFDFGQFSRSPKMFFSLRLPKFDGARFENSVSFLLLECSDVVVFFLFGRLLS